MSPLSNSPLSLTDRRTLLEIARRSITEKILHGRDWFPENFSGALSEPCGAFVTLERKGRLRGCMGQPFAPDPLAHVVAHCAISAAQKDTRFSPVTQAEVPELSIAVSVLSPLVRIDPSQIEIGRHGLHISNGPFRGLLLPQVPIEHHWNAERFLQETCNKAGLPSDAWKSPDTQIQSFTAEIFSDLTISDQVSPTPRP